MGFFNKKKKQTETEKKEQPASQTIKKTELKQYITGAGGCIVSKSLLNGTTKLKWIFREENGFGNGWVAFGDKDSQEYLDNSDNLTIVDFNTLANIEPTVLNILYMPVGTDLEFCSDETGKYFIDTKTGQEIRELVKHPAQLAFEQNLKFLNQDSYPSEFFQGLFQNNDKLETFIVGETDFPSGNIVLADPLSYLGNEKYQTPLERTIPAGSYPVELSICHSKIAGLRIAAARLKISNKKIVNYELALADKFKLNISERPDAFSLFGVDAGLACFADADIATEYNAFTTGWYKENKGKNIYDDYFAALFQKSYEQYPALQRDGGDFLLWQIPQTGHRLIMFASGMGDGIYSGYWGLDEDGTPAELVIPFMNPDYF